MNLEEIQQELRSQQLDGWLFFDHHHRDPIAYRVLGLESGGHVSRRWYYWLPARREPVKLVHGIEHWVLDALPGAKETYSTWDQQKAKLGGLLGGAKRVAMQYSPNCAIPYVSLVDAGTVELIRGFGVEVVSSALLVQAFEAAWSAEQLEMHREAGRRIDVIRREAFEEIGRRVRSEGAVQEIAIADFIRSRFREEGLAAAAGPIVAVNANSGNPHYEPKPDKSSPIRPRDFVLIDLWAKLDRPRAVFYDVTWTGYLGGEPSGEIRNVFGIVCEARDRALEFVASSVREGRRIAGYQVDDVARQTIQDQGFGDAFVHRTGHSIGEEVHGAGVNLDNLETHDERTIIPRICFSIEPGIYLPEFGVRSEIDCYVSESGAEATGEVQRELVRVEV